MTADELSSVRPYDEILLTGVASSPHGQRFERLTGTVATVSLNNPPAIKVWPDDVQVWPQPINDGKLWFLAAGLESVELLHREPS